MAPVAVIGALSSAQLRPARAQEFASFTEQGISAIAELGQRELGRVEMEKYAKRVRAAIRASLLLLHPVMRTSTVPYKSCLSHGLAGTFAPPGCGVQTSMCKQCSTDIDPC